MTTTRMHLTGILLNGAGFQTSPLSTRLTIYRTDDGLLPDDGDGQPDTWSEPLETRRNGEVWEIGNGAWWFQMDGTGAARMGLA